ncbi:unnamed protein product [Prunus armeniaca]
MRRIRPWGRADGCWTFVAVARFLALMTGGGAVLMATVPWRRGAALAMEGGPVLMTRGQGGGATV